jgi:hypothetical protein
MAGLEESMRFQIKQESMNSLIRPSKECRYIYIYVCVCVIKRSFLEAQ